MKFHDMGEQQGEKMVAWHCPGCEGGHAVPVSGPRAWGFNGDLVKPTLTPSVLCNGTRLTAAGRADYDVWAAANYPHRDAEFDHEPLICHTFVKEGMIQFLSDCSHKFAGQTVEVPDWD